jgi:hypothetical protein
VDAPSQAAAGPGSSSSPSSSGGSGTRSGSGFRRGTRGITLLSGDSLGASGCDFEGGPSSDRRAGCSLPFWAKSNADAHKRIEGATAAGSMTWSGRAYDTSHPVSVWARELCIEVRGAKLIGCIGISLCRTPNIRSHKTSENFRVTWLPRARGATARRARGYLPAIRLPARCRPRRKILKLNMVSRL